MRTPSRVAMWLLTADESRAERQQQQAATRREGAEAASEGSHSRQLKEAMVEAMVKAMAKAKSTTALIQNSQSPTRTLRIRDQQRLPSASSATALVALTW